MRTLLALMLTVLFGCCGSAAADPPGSWIPNVEFSLEDGDRAQTLTWISGWSYALTAVVREQAADSKDRLFCLPGRESVESRIMLDALNKQFSGKRITSEQAAAVLWATVKKHYACSQQENSNAQR